MLQKESGLLRLPKELLMAILEWALCQEELPACTGPRLQNTLILSHVCQALRNILLRDCLFPWDSLDLTLGKVLEGEEDSTATGSCLDDTEAEETVMGLLDRLSPSVKARIKDLNASESGILSLKSLVKILKECPNLTSLKLMEAERLSVSELAAQLPVHFPLQTAHPPLSLIYLDMMMAGLHTFTSLHAYQEYWCEGGQLLLDIRLLSDWMKGHERARLEFTHELNKENLPTHHQDNSAKKEDEKLKDV